MTANRSCVGSLQRRELDTKPARIRRLFWRPRDRLLRPAFGSDQHPAPP
jgi:hypothetical protein